MDVSQLQQKVDAVDKMVVAETSRKGYIGKMVNLLTFAMAAEAQTSLVLDPEFKQGFGAAAQEDARVYAANAAKNARKASPKAPKPVVKRRLEYLTKHLDDKKVAPFPLAALDANFFKLWMASQAKGDGLAASYSVVKQSRSALHHLYRLYNQSALFDEKIGPSLSTYAGGAKRNKARARDDVGGRERNSKDGKEPLPWEVYEFLTQKMLEEGTDGLFSGVYLSVSANLMCRSSNTEEVFTKDIVCRADALAIVFAHMKNDQEGNRKKPRHCYANSQAPWLSMPFWLGMWFLIFEWEKNGKLFGGSAQYSR